MSDTSYHSALGHLLHHKPKEWLLQGCRDEDARTIMELVEKIPHHRLCRRLARALTKDSSQ